MTEDNLAHAREQAKAQYESIAETVARLEHSQECNADDLEECDLYEGISPLYPWLEMGMDFDDYHDEEKAREAIRKGPLSVKVRSDWHTPGDEAEASEFCILLCTGGPAVRICGDLGNYSEPTRAYMQCQDWFTPWTDYLQTDSNVLLAYAREFWYDE